MDRIAWFASLVVLPNIIVQPGKYLTRGGEVVTVAVAAGRATRFDCVGVYPNGIPERWHRSGRLYFGMKSANDIVAPYSN